MASDPSLTTSVHESLESLERLRPEWNALLRQYPSSSTFSSYEWLTAWWRAFGNQDRLLVVAFRDASSALVALAPLAVTSRGSFPLRLRMLRLMGDGSNDSDNLDLPVRPGVENQFAESLFRFLQRESWDFAQFNTMPPGSLAANALRKMLAQEKWPTFEKQTVASAIALPASWEEYLQQLSAKERGKVAYYSKRLEKKYQTRFYRCRSASELPACLDALFRLHQKRWQSAGQKGSFISEARRQFYLDLSRELLAENLLEFWLVDLDGEPAAAQFGFRFRDTVAQLQEGFDRRYSTDSVGYVLRARVIQELISEGVRTYDFLGGEPGYKAKWGAQSGHYINLSFARPFSAGAACLKSREFAARSKSWLRRTLPPTAWQRLHRINVALTENRGEPGTASDAGEGETTPDSTTKQK